MSCSSSATCELLQCRGSSCCQRAKGGACEGRNVTLANSHSARALFVTSAVWESHWLPAAAAVTLKPLPCVLETCCSAGAMLLTCCIVATCGHTAVQSGYVLQISETSCSAKVMLPWRPSVLR